MQGQRLIHCSKFVSLTLSLLSLAACTFGPLPPVIAAPPDRDRRFTDDAERELIRLLNEERAQRGLPKLDYEEKLRESAREHAREMADRKRLSHQFPGEPALRDRVAGTGLRFDRVAENVAYNNSAEDAHVGLMQSKGHRTNILNPEYNTVGVGVVRVGDRLYITQNFAHRLPELSVAQVEQTISRAVREMRGGGRSFSEERLSGMRDAACSMAKRDEISTRAIPIPDRTREQAVVAYTETRPERLPESVLKYRRDGRFQRFALCSCFAKTDKYPSGTYWVAMVFF
jgi:uncharacterized protein YkwD